jgi:hypothetical protein
MTAVITALVFFGLPTLVGLMICSDSKRREQEHARRRHPSNYERVDEVTVWPCFCESCGRKVYEVPTDGHDLLLVLLADRDAFEYAVKWHRQYECSAVSA